MKDTNQDTQGNTCTWSADCDGIWTAGCGYTFCFDGEGMPSDHKFRFCPKCGKPLTEQPYKEQNE